MILYPAVDLMGGKCVRLTQGRRDAVTVYFDDPAEPARRWAGMGARWIHVVDLDAAFEARCFANRPSVEMILKAVGKGARVQVGGGVRKLDDIQEYLDLGVSRVIVGTSVLASREFSKEVFSRFGARVAVSIDARDGKVALRGWQDQSTESAVDAVYRLIEDGAAVFIITSIQNDGMLSGVDSRLMMRTSGTASSKEYPVILPNKNLIQTSGTYIPIQTSTPSNPIMLQRPVSIRNAEFIAAGGISTVADIDYLDRIENSRITGAVIGKALYTGTFDLESAISKYPQPQDN